MLNIGLLYLHHVMFISRYLWSMLGCQFCTKIILGLNRSISLFTNSSNVLLRKIIRIFKEKWVQKLAREEKFRNEKQDNFEVRLYNFEVRLDEEYCLTRNGY